MQWLKQRGSAWAESGWLSRVFFETTIFRLQNEALEDKENHTQ